MSALRYGPSTLRWRSPVVKRLSDERLVASVRRGNHADFTVLVKRYETRLLAFCRQMLRSREDAEDVLQEVFVAAFNAILADDRPINVQPWLYRIARNRSLNHMRRIKAISVDPMEMPESEVSAGTVETVHAREELWMLVGDIQKLPESQRSALLLREMEALSYDQIAEAMDKSVPSVKSLLVRARVSLASAREERALHRKVAALVPLGSLMSVKRLLIGQLGPSTGAGGATAAAGTGGAAIAGSSSGSAVALGVGAVATKTAAGLAAAALVTAGAVAIEDGGQHPRHHHRGPVAAAQGTASTRMRGAEMVAAAPGESAPGPSTPAPSGPSGLQHGPMQAASRSSSPPPRGHGSPPAGASPAPVPAPVAPTPKHSQDSGQAPGQPSAIATTARVVTDVNSSSSGSATDTTTTTTTTTTSTTMMATATTATATTATATASSTTTQSTSTFTPGIGPTSHETTSAVAIEGRPAHHRDSRHRRAFAAAGPRR